MYLIPLYGPYAKQKTKSHQQFSQTLYSNLKKKIGITWHMHAVWRPLIAKMVGIFLENSEDLEAKIK